MFNFLIGSLMIGGSGLIPTAAKVSTVTASPQKTGRPGRGCSSSINTSAPSSAAVEATVHPAGPAPITAMSGEKMDARPVA